MKLTPMLEYNVSFDILVVHTELSLLPSIYIGSSWYIFPSPNIYMFQW